MEKKKLLSDLSISDGTGKQVAENVFKQLQDCKIDEKIIGLSFNTTSTDTGCKNGANIFLEMFLEKPL